MSVKGYAIHLSFSPGNAVLRRDKTPQSTRTQGGDTIADYIMADTPLPIYLPYPRFLLKMEISQTAKLLYSLLLDRSTLSQKNKWQDDEGRIYIIYPIAEIAEILDKGSTTIKGALNELDMAGLLERERGGFSAPNRLYVKVPRVPQVQFSDQLMAGKPILIEPENRPTDGQKTDLMMVGKPSPNQTTMLVFAHQALFRQQYIQRLVARFDESIVDRHDVVDLFHFGAVKIIFAQDRTDGVLYIVAFYIDQFKIRLMKFVLALRLPKHPRYRPVLPLDLFDLDEIELYV